MSKWSSLAGWVGPTQNRTPNGMIENRGLVVHIAEGYFQGTINWQLNPVNDVSSHFVVGDGEKGQGYDGQIAQVVDTFDAAWTQRAGNGHWLSVECAGFTPNRLTPAQAEAVAQLFANGVRLHGWPLKVAKNPNDRGLGHHSMGTPAEGWTGPTWGHEDCPGPNIIAQLQGIVNRAAQIVNGTTPVRELDVSAFYIIGFPQTPTWVAAGNLHVSDASPQGYHVLEAQPGWVSAAFPDAKTVDAKNCPTGWTYTKILEQLFGPGYTAEIALTDDEVDRIADAVAAKVPGITHENMVDAVQEGVDGMVLKSPV